MCVCIHEITLQFQIIGGGGGGGGMGGGLNKRERRGGGPTDNLNINKRGVQIKWGGGGV